jgi:hypothetical protein
VRRLEVRVPQVVSRAGGWLFLSGGELQLLPRLVVAALAKQDGAEVVMGERIVRLALEYDAILPLGPGVIAGGGEFRRPFPRSRDGEKDQQESQDSHRALRRASSVSGSTRRRRRAAPANQM